MESQAPHERSLEITGRNFVSPAVLQVNAAHRMALFCSTNFGLRQRAPLMIRPTRLVLILAGALSFVSTARAEQCQDYTFACLDPAFLQSETVPAYAHEESALSPAKYEPGNGDFLAQFT